MIIFHFFILKCFLLFYFVLVCSNVMWIFCILNVSAINKNINKNEQHYSDTQTLSSGTQRNQFFLNNTF